MLFQSSGAAVMRPALLGMARSVSLGGFMEAHYPVALMSAWFLSRDNGFLDATRDAIAHQAAALMREKAPLFDAVQAGRCAADAGRVIASALHSTAGTYRTGSGGGHDMIYGSMALKVHAEFPELFDDQVVEGICDLISACHTGEPETYTADDLKRFPQFHEPQNIADVIDNVLWDLSHDLGFHGHIMTHGQALLQLYQLGHEQLVSVGMRKHFAHVISCQRWKQTEGALSKWLPRDPAMYSPVTPVYWKQEAGSEFWRGGHTFKYCYSFFEIKRAFPVHKMIAEGERSLQWLV
jgi:hypothetical protein